MSWLPAETQLEPLRVTQLEPPLSTRFFVSRLRQCCVPLARRDRPRDRTKTRLVRGVAQQQLICLLFKSRRLTASSATKHHGGNCWCSRHHTFPPHIYKFTSWGPASNIPSYVSYNTTFLIKNELHDFPPLTTREPCPLFLGTTARLGSSVDFWLRPCTPTDDDRQPPGS